MASILKPRSLPPGVSLRQFEDFNWEDVLARAREHLQGVREQSQRLIAEAKEEVARVREAACAEGKRDALGQLDSMAEQKAAKLADERIGQSLRAADQLVDQMQKATETWLRQWQHETIPLAISIAERLVRRQIDVDPAALLQWVGDAISLARAEHHLCVRIHPSDRKRLGPHLDRFIAAAARGRQIEVVEDESVQSPGVIVQANELHIDAQLSTQLDRLIEEMS